MIHKLFWLALAGALGTLARYGLAGLVHKIDGSSFPWGTLVVNITGCFIVGILWTLFESRLPISSEFRSIILIGFMGSFTTFSAFILESGELARASEWMYFAFNVIGQTGIGFTALYVGATIGRII